MTNEVSYRVLKIEDVPERLMRDLNTHGKGWAVLRTSPVGIKVWSFHTTEKTADAARRRGNSREIRTR